MLMTTSDKNCFICAVDDELPLHFYQSARSTSNPKVHAGWCKTVDIWNIYTRERAPATMHIGWARQPWLSIASRSLSACNMSRVVERVAQAHELCRSAASTLPQACALHFSFKKEFCVAFWRRSKAHYLPRNVVVGCVFLDTVFPALRAEELKNSYLKGFYWNGTQITTCWKDIYMNRPSVGQM